MDAENQVWETEAFVFDIEGTIYKKGKLQLGAIKLFTKLIKDGRPIIFVSGMNETEIKRVVDLIKQETGLNFRPGIISNAGANIKQSGKTNIITPLDTQSIFSIKKVVNEVAPDALVVYRTTTQNFRQKVADTDGLANKIKRAETLLVKDVLELMKKVELNCIPLEDDCINANIEKGNYFSMEIIALPSSIVKISKALKNIDLNNTFITINNASMQVSGCTKWQALQKLLKDKASDVCYLGDNVNDMECITNCKKAILANSKNTSMFKLLNELQKNGERKFATRDLGNSEVIKYVLGEEYDTKQLIDQTQLAKQSIKPSKELSK